jgi:hypothetical protein
LLPGNDFWIFDDHLIRVHHFSGDGDIVDEAVTARVDRSRILRESGRTFAIVLAETVLRYRLGDAGVMAGQLGSLLSAMDLSTVSLGIIPAAAERSMWAIESFTVFDDQRVDHEPLSASVKITAPGEVEQYLAAFGSLHQQAKFGSENSGVMSGSVMAMYRPRDAQIPRLRPALRPGVGSYSTRTVNGQSPSRTASAMGRTGPGRSLSTTTASNCAAGRVCWARACKRFRTLTTTDTNGALGSGMGTPRARRTGRRLARRPRPGRPCEHPAHAGAAEHTGSAPGRPAPS